MLIFLLIFVFIFGAIVGSLLNVCIYRIPLEKSILWPGSRCGQCFQPVRWYDNIPLVSYLVLRGRCRTCGASFSARYFLIELLTGCCFAGLFYLEIVHNGFGIPELASQRQRLEWHEFPTWQAWVFFCHHAVLLSLLIVVTFCDLDHREIPISLTVTGTVIGLVSATLLPWPWPSAPAAYVQKSSAWDLANLPPPLGLYPWPVWRPLPAWLPPGSWQLGLATGVMGLLVGTLMLRAVRFLFSTGLGVEALGLGDADLMMMAGSFLGWQPLIVAFFISVVPGLLFAVVHIGFRWLMAHGRRTMMLKVGWSNQQPSLKVDGQELTLDEWSTTCSRLVTEERKTRALLDAHDLEARLGRIIADIGDAARQAGIRNVREISPFEAPGLLERLLRVFGFVGRQQRSLKVETVVQDGNILFKIEDQVVAAEQLVVVLKELTKEWRKVELLIDSHGLERWLDRILGQIRMTAVQAGVRKIYRRDNAIPFGPALAVGLMVSLLAWPWFVARGSLVILFFNSMIIWGMAGACALIMLVSSYTIRVTRLIRNTP